MNKARYQQLLVLLYETSQELEKFREQNPEQCQEWAAETAAFIEDLETEKAEVING